ncbi:MAG: hypothetical protein ACD_19C00112G0001, partial [uncultured bacterium]
MLGAKFFRHGFIPITEGVQTGLGSFDL